MPSVSVISRATPALESWGFRLEGHKIKILSIHLCHCVWCGEKKKNVCAKDVMCVQDPQSNTYSKQTLHAGRNNVNKPTWSGELEEGAELTFRLGGGGGGGGRSFKLPSYGKRVRSERVWRADAVGIRPKLEPLTPKIAWVPLRRGHANLLCIVPILVYVLREQYTRYCTPFS